MVTRDFVIANEKGIHVRPASLLAKSVSMFDSEITVSKDGVTVPGRDVMGILSLCAEKGTIITIKASGPDEQAAIEELRKIIEEQLHFD